ncbi:MAG TPA: hypothetical protein VK157_12755 [Phycisphaerales bacterium]|nr:hypothetical protein [Phycisphaerales bacterium]
MLVQMSAAAIAIATLSGAAQAALVQTTMTADNHYAIYADNGGVITFIDGNELGRLGDPGDYNWSLPETMTFNATTAIYIAAWSDDAYAQGLLGDLTIDGQDFSTGNPAWRVYRTGLDRDDDQNYPTSADVATQLGIANSNNLWEVPHVGGLNGIQPWGVIPGVSTNNARWMWATQTGDTDPLVGGIDVGEYLIFCIPVPTPGALALAGMGGLLAIRRKR